MSIRILGTGSYVPEKVITNDQLSTFIETSDEWISQRVGVRERHVSVNETAADMAIAAATRALEASGLTADALDLIIAATISSDTICPTVAGSVQTALGAHCPAFDLNSACSGFLFALDTAVSFITRGTAMNVLVLGAERMSKIINWKDRSTCVIFGDGAGAAVVTKGDGYLASKLYTQGDHTVIQIPTDLGHSPFYQREPAGQPFVLMQGQETFRFAVQHMTEDITALAEQAGISLQDIRYIVPHQANKRILDFAAKRLGIPLDRMVCNITHYGNTSSASVAIALDELARNGDLQRGDLIVMCAFGGGLSSAACLIKY